MMIYNPFYFWQPYLPNNCDLPPTVYAVLNSIVNGLKEPSDYTKIRNLAKEGRSVIFNFEYPLSENISKEEFETLILNHYLERRIGYETVTSFRIHLDAKLNEIMPKYNKMFDALSNWNIFKDGEIMTRKGFDNRTSESENDAINNLENTSRTYNTSDRRYSELPQNEISNITDGNYMTDYNFDTNNANDNSNSKGTSKSTQKGKDDNIYEETIEKTNANKIEILKQMQSDIKSIYSLIFKELDDLFYGLV